jgi:hypothetical protein
MATGMSDVRATIGPHRMSARPITCRRRGFIFGKRWRTGLYLADKNLVEN